MCKIGIEIRQLSKLMNLKTLAFVLLLNLSATSCIQAQDVFIDARDEALNTVLTELRDNYSIPLSFDDRKLSKYKVTLTSYFDSPAQAIQKLIEGLPFEFEQQAEVIIIYPKKKRKSKPKLFKLSGRVLESGTGEPLPYSHILVNGKGLISDQNGNYVFSSTKDSVFQLKASHLGYYIIDTVFMPGANRNILLTPSVIGLSEIVIKDKKVELSTQIGIQAGVEKLNHKIANFLPGYGDNSVFNLLRLQPGILASGEQTNELIIWGSYEGHSKVDFDGFTMYALKNFNDNISTFNPLMAKDIEVLKGGYDARYGERVGGIVNINGKNGSKDKVSFNLVANNMTLNGLIEIPVQQKTGALVIAFRHTYYNLYNPSDMNFLIRKNNDSDSTNDVDVNIVPDYRFSDLNIKYSQQFSENDQFYISLYLGGDKFSYGIEEPVKFAVIDKQTSEQNTQLGSSVFYEKSWKNGNTSNLTMSLSNLSSNYFDDLILTSPGGEVLDTLTDIDSRNNIQEFTLETENRFSLNQTHTLEFGLGIKTNSVNLDEDTFAVNRALIEAQASRIIGYMQDVMNIGKNLSLKTGFRFTYAFNLNKAYLEPRISLSVKSGNFWRFNLAWGMYNQFITKTSIVDDLGNYRYLWAICNNEDIPVLQGHHFVIGTSYNRKRFTLSIETYYKTTTGLTRFVSFPNKEVEEVSEGHGFSLGIDFMVKTDFRRHSIWLSYSLSKTLEKFDYFNYFNYDDYIRAPQDQTHELKLAALFNWDPFYLSGNYVFGSGFPYGNTAPNSSNETDYRYSRLDVSFVYKFLDRRWKGEVGLSILNLLNTQNIKYSNFERIPAYMTNTINIYAEAIPFTPTLYVKIGF